jgi:hypothetical protein
MLSRFRSSLVWLLLLALPLQGFAAAAMLHCGPSHHRMLAASSVAAAESHMHAHMHATSGHHHGQETGLEHGAADAGTPAAHDLDTLSKFKCSACAACCTGAAMPTAALFIPSLPPAGTPAVALIASRAEFLSGGLDRPPRILLA